MGGGDSDFLGRKVTQRAAPSVSDLTEKALADDCDEDEEKQESVPKLARKALRVVEK